MQHNQQPGASPVGKQLMVEKREFRDLNTRLQMYIRTQSDKKSNVERLKRAITTQEVEFRKKMKLSDQHWNQASAKLRKEIEVLNFSLKRTREDAATAQKNAHDYEERLHTSEARCTNLDTSLQARLGEIATLKQELEQLRGNYATMKYKFESFSSNRQSLNDQIEANKIKNDQLMRELNKKTADLRSEQEAFQRLLCDKNEEIDQCKDKIKNLEYANTECQSRLREEFDGKLADFVQKREEQYKAEKDEWMRIFKEEFNRKLRSFKEANFELSHINKKREEECNDLRLRVSKLKQIKTELEIANRNQEEDVEKLTNENDMIRHTKDEELIQKGIIINNLRDKYKAKELQFDELAGMKLQLDAEIQLYKRILDEAENDAGYLSPLAPSYGKTAGFHNTRKRRRLNGDETNRMSAQTTACNGEMGPKITTPGIGRAAMTARGDFATATFQKIASPDHNVSNHEREREEDEQKEESCNHSTLLHDLIEDADEADNSNLKIVNNIQEINLQTPEGPELQFSSMDLNKCMIELCNVTDKPLLLDGYTITNSDASASFALPATQYLEAGERLSVFVGSQVKQLKKHRRNLQGKNKLGKPNPTWIYWVEDVWMGDSEDAVRLYDPSNQQIAKIEIHPDMIQMDATQKKGCCVM